MTISNRFIMNVATALSLLTATTLQAGEVVGFSWHSGVASLAATTIVPAVAPNNDDVAGMSPNQIFVTQKNYFAIGPVDVVFDVANSGGVTEYFIREGVFNNTGLDWHSYHLELGFGFDAGFVKSTSGDGLDFDAPDFNSPFNFNPNFPTVVVTEDDILASGGVHPYLGFAGNYRFTVDVPDGITSFTVRQSPIAAVPEPTTLALVAFSFVSIATYGRRWRRGQDG